VLVETEKVLVEKNCGELLANAKAPQKNFRNLHNFVGIIYAYQRKALFPLSLPHTKVIGESHHTCMGMDEEKYMERVVGLGWRQDNGNRSNQESKFDFLATLVKIDNGQEKIKIICSNQQSNWLPLPAPP